MTVDYLVLCDEVIEANGQWSLVGVYDAITAEGFWVQMANVMIVARLRGVPGEVADAELRWSDAAGATLVAEPWRLVVGPGGTAFSAIEASGPRLPRPGDYRLTVSIAGRVLASLVLPAVLGPPRQRRVH